MAGCLAAVWVAHSNAQVQKYEVVFNNLKASGNELEGIGLISGVQNRSRIRRKCHGSGDISDPPLQDFFYKIFTSSNDVLSHLKVRPLGRDRSEILG